MLCILSHNIIHKHVQSIRYVICYVNPSTIWIENVALSRIGVVIVGARKFSEHLQSSKMPKTNGQHFFFDQCPNLELVPNELSRDFQRIKSWDTGSGQEMIAFFISLALPWFKGVGKLFFSQFWYRNTKIQGKWILVLRVWGAQNSNLVNWNEEDLFYKHIFYLWSQNGI
jgi:hypothetical protein